MNESNTTRTETAEELITRVAGSFTLTDEDGKPAISNARKEMEDYIRDNLDCRQFLTASRKGGRDMYNCPVCGSGTGPKGTGACKLYPSNRWKCHACGASGDVIDLLQMAHHEGFTEALKEGAKMLGVELPPVEVEPAADQQHPDGQSHADPEPQADYSDYYQACQKMLANSPAAREYLEKRGISLETAQQAGIGFDPQADPANMPGETDFTKKHPHPWPRLIIPVTQSHYIARAILPTEPGLAKINSKGSHPAIFNAAAIWPANEGTIVFVCEGWADALSLAEIGQPAIALNSKSNGKMLLDALKDKPTSAKFVISFDNDVNPVTAASTDAAARKLANDLGSIGVKAIVYKVQGKHHDVNDCLTEGGREELENNAAAAMYEVNRDYVSDFLEKIQTEAYKPTATGLPFFDDLLGGGIIQQSLLLLLAAPGAGKTTLCQQIAEGMALKGKDVIYLNFEMSREQMLAKAISARTCQKGFHVSATQVMQGYKWNEKQREAILAEVKAYRQESFPHIQYNTGTNCSTAKSLQAYLDKIGTAARREGRNGPAVVLDYLQLMISDAGEDQQTTIKETVMLLKDYARQYNTFVIGIVATNRESNKSGVISLTSGRDSSNIEYTADIQLSLNYEDIDSGMVKPDDVRAVAELQRQPLRNMILRVLKNRFAMPGKEARVYFNAADNLFLEMGKTEGDDGAIRYRATHDAPDQPADQSQSQEDPAPKGPTYKAVRIL